jgi:hypothetical protein
MDELSTNADAQPQPFTTPSLWVPVSINRRLVLDGLRFAHHVPLFPAERFVDLSEAGVLRKHVPRRVSWAAIFVKAYALVAKNHRQLRQTFIRWPWPHFVQEPHSTAMVVVNREFRGEDRICWGRIAQPEAKSLIDIQRQLDCYQREPVEQVYRQQIRLGKFPAPIRRLFYWLNMNFGGRKRAKRLGTFTMSTLAGQGVFNRGHQTFLTTSLTYGPLDEHGRALVTLLCDHRVVDGVVAARALGDLETVLRGPIVAELKSLQSSRAAA